jgi:hypothetical protein
MLAEEFEVILVETFDYARAVALESSGLRFVGRGHLVAEDGVDRHVEPKASVIRSFGLNALVESGIPGSYTMNQMGGEDGINWMGPSFVCAGGVVAVPFEDNVSHPACIEEGSDGIGPDVFITVHHKDDVFPISNPSINFGSEVI